NVEWLVGDARAVFTYDGTSFDVDCNEPAAIEIERLCRALAQGVDPTELPASFGEFASHATELVDTFDHYGFLTEASPAQPHDVISGTVFWREVEAFARRAKTNFRPVFYDALRSGRVHKEHLIRYATEYYHVVRCGPQIIAGALPHATDAGTRSVLENFLTSELGHDRLLLRALESVDVSSDVMQKSLPLPETFAVISALQVAADQEPLTFKAIVFLLEEPSLEFHEALIHACKQAGLEPEFWTPIIRHAGINDEGGHGNISARLLSHVEVVSVEERLVVLKQLATLIELIVGFERALLR
ncbi:MAG TPA: iron-containing redox enzyme family protein, partial [Pyrinomonadaceae bacterium]|nr:iron-containing redox enzyme family protein [Pyrinomonadaceae bacterium]